MERKLTLFFLLLFFSSPLLLAQVTISSTDYQSPLGDTLVSVNVFSPTLIGDYFAPPSEGRDQTWDYRWLELTSYNRYPVPEVSSPQFPMSNTTSQTVFVADFTPDFPLPTQLFEQYSDNGKNILGEQISNTFTVPFSCESCTEADSVRYDPVLNDFAEPEQVLQLPLNFGDNWISSYVRKINMQLFLPSFSLNDEMAQQTDSVVVSYGVVGSGNLVLPNLSYSGTQEMEVLLVRRTATTTSYYTVAGLPAPQALLDTLGLQNGQTETNTFYQFFAKGLDQPALNIGFFPGSSLPGYTVAGSISEINPSTEGTFSAQTIMHDGAERTYHLYIPPGYDDTQATSLVVALHGYSSSATQFAWQSEMNQVADTAGFMVVYPQGDIVNGLPGGPLPPQAPGWNIPGAPITSTVDDIGFIVSVVDEIQARYNVNENRVYATGISNGGFMTSVLAAARPDLFAAVGTCAGVFPAPRAGLVPTMVVHGTADPLVPFAGDPVRGFPSVSEVVNLWSLNNACNFLLPDSTNLPDLDPNDGSTVTRFEYQRCAGNADVVLLRVNGGSHVWDGGSPVPPLFIPVIGGTVNRDIHASEEMWHFFQNYELPNSRFVHETIMVDSIEREYTVYVPANYDGTEDWPLVFNLHEANAPVPLWVATVNTNQVADTADFLVVYPTALPGFVGPLDTISPIWQDGTFAGNQTADDVSFFDQLIDRVNTDYAIDVSRVYLAGGGSGGAASAFLATQLPDRIAAIANVQGYIADGPPRPIPGLFMAGTEDPFVPLGGIPGVLPPFSAGVQAWVSANACDTVAEQINLPDLVLGDSSTVTLFTYPNCTSDSEVLYYQINEGGRNWPGGLPAPGGGVLNLDINADVEIWNFFNRNRLATSTKVVQPEQFKVSVYPNPSFGELNFEFDLPEDALVRIDLYNSLGQTVAPIMNQRLRQGRQRIQWRQNSQLLPTGIYYYRLQIGRSVVSRPVVIR